MRSRSVFGIGVRDGTDWGLVFEIDVRDGTDLHRLVFAIGVRDGTDWRLVFEIDVRDGTDWRLVLPRSRAIFGQWSRNLIFSPSR